MNRASKLALMSLSLGVCTAAAIVHGGWLRPAPAKPAELYQVVWKQIHAFRNSDYSGAYQQISSTFQERVDMDTFPEMVRTDYPDLLRADHIEFGNSVLSPHRALLHVYFVLPSGETVPCLYSLIKEDSGWKIDGARVQKRWPNTRRLGAMRT